MARIRRSTAMNLVGMAAVAGFCLFRTHRKNPTSSTTPPGLNQGPEGLPSMPSFDARRLEPAFLRVSTHRGPGILAGLFFLASVALLLLGTVGAPFTSERPWSIWSDWRRVFDDPSVPSSTIASITLIRDYPTVLTVTTAAATIPLYYANCCLFSEVVARVVTWNAVGPAHVPLVKEVERAARAYDRVGRLSWLCWVAGVACMVAILYAYFNTDNFIIFDAGPRDGVPMTLQWWVTSGLSTATGISAYLIVGASCLYIYIKHNVLGYVMLRFFIRLRSTPWQAMDFLNPDGHYGWDPLRRLLLRVYVAVVISGLAAAALWVSITQVNRFIASPILILFFFSIPAHAILPTLLLNEASRRTRERRIEQVVLAFKMAATAGRRTRSERAATEEVFRNEIAAIRKLRPELFKLRTIFVSSALYIAPLAAVVISVAQGGADPK